ncbi:hypothetical protein AAMO2058_000282800 [Amorphochlora amoebiformis]
MRAGVGMFAVALGWLVLGTHAFSVDSLKAKGVRDLRKILLDMKGSTRGIVEKNELVQRILDLQDTCLFNEDAYNCASEIEVTIGKPVTEKLQDLDCITYQTHRKPKVLIVLLHGHGANKEDLYSLTSQIIAQFPSLQARFIFPQAPITLQYGSYTWWDLDIGDLMSRLMQFGPRELFNGQSDEVMADVQTRIQNIIETQLSLLNLAPSQVLIGGFSQGSFLATQITLNYKDDFGGLAILSGGLYVPDKWTNLVKKKREGISIVQSHGTADPIIPYQQGLMLKKLFEDAKWNYRFIPFNGQHSIPRESIQALGNIAFSLQKQMT